MHNAEFDDPRLVEVYDAESPWARDDDYFTALVDETPGARVLDLGCGTGRLALALAAAGHVVTGIDPSLAALAAERAKAGAERVSWIHGTAESARERTFDVVIMTGHVSQFLLGEDAWQSALRALRRALVPGGRRAFHAYDPEARIWGAVEPTRLAPAGRHSCRHEGLDLNRGHGPQRRHRQLLSPLPLPRR